eukprot:8805590-Lingulodinium_polyedra.AAC.1
MQSAVSSPCGTARAPAGPFVVAAPMGMARVLLLFWGFSSEQCQPHRDCPRKKKPMALAQQSNLRHRSCAVQPTVSREQQQNERGQRRGHGPRPRLDRQGLLRRPDEPVDARRCPVTVQMHSQGLRPLRI